MNEALEGSNKERKKERKKELPENLKILIINTTNLLLLEFS